MLAKLRINKYKTNSNRIFSIALLLNFYGLSKASLVFTPLFLELNSKPTDKPHTMRRQ